MGLTKEFLTNIMIISKKKASSKIIKAICNDLDS